MSNDAWGQQEADPWDDLPAGNFMKWQNPGQDQVIGMVTAKRKGHSLQGDEVPELDIARDDGSEVTVTASQGQLAAKLREANPRIGDRIRIRFIGVEPRQGGQTLKHFDVAVQPGQGQQMPQQTPQQTFSGSQTTWASDPAPTQQFPADDF